MKKIILISIIVGGFLSCAYAGIDISTDNRSLFFGLMHLGEEKELTQSGAYHNQITCKSTNGRSWYLKISLLQPLSCGVETIPLDYFKWQLVWTNGKGMTISPYQLKPFNLIPDSVYISGADETSGSPIDFQFKYYLKIPEMQISGVYNATIRFTLTEIF